MKDDNVSNEEAIAKLNDEFNGFIEEANRIKILIKEAKTPLKRELYKKKLEKIKQKTFKTLINKAIANPQLLKKQEEDKDEQI